MRPTSSPLLGLLLLLGCGACAHAFIPGTQLRDTEDNRAIYTVLNAIQASMEKRDAAALLALVSTKYFEDNATPDPRDDYGYTELRDRLLKESMDVAKEVFVSFEVHEIVVHGDEAIADVRYAVRSRIELPAGRVWDTHRDFSRFQFVREDGAWRLVRGL